MATKICIHYLHRNRLFSIGKIEEWKLSKRVTQLTNEAILCFSAIFIKQQQNNDKTGKKKSEAKIGGIISPVNKTEGKIQTMA